VSDQRFRREYRIRSSRDFRRAYQRRASASDQWLLVFAHPNDTAHPRLGLSVSRKVGGAVVRNRWKRLIREAFRLSRERLPKGVDLVVIPRQGVDPSLADLIQSLPRVARRAAGKLTKERR